MKADAKYYYGTYFNVAFQDGTIHDVATKVGDYNKTGVCPGPSLKPSLNI